MDHKAVSPYTFIITFSSFIRNPYPFSFIYCTFEAEVFIIHHPLDDHLTNGGWSSNSWCMIMQRLLEDEFFLKKPLSSPIETSKRSRRIGQKIYNHLNTAQMSANYKLVRNPNPNPEESGKSLPLHPRWSLAGRYIRVSSSIERSPGLLSLPRIWKGSCSFSKTWWWTSSCTVITWS